MIYSKFIFTYFKVFHFKGIFGQKFPRMNIVEDVENYCYDGNDC